MENFLKQFFFDCSLIENIEHEQVHRVLGIYNCQGVACTERKNAFRQTTTKALTDTIRGRDVHLIAEAATDPNWNGNCVLYCHQTG
jgi:raffinose synthase